MAETHHVPSPWWKPTTDRMVIGAALLVGCLAIALSILNAVGQNRLSAQRADDITTSQYEGCLRGNDLRRQIQAIGTATDESIGGILDRVLATSRAPAAEVAALRKELDTPLAEIREAVADIELNDCDALFPQDPQADR
jgi:hypothetical protein